MPVKKKHDGWYERASTMTRPRLLKFLQVLEEGDHDYEDAIHACAAAALAAANLVAAAGSQLTEVQKQAVAEEFRRRLDWPQREPEE